MYTAGIGIGKTAGHHGISFRSDRPFWSIISVQLSDPTSHTRQTIHLFAHMVADNQSSNYSSGRNNEQPPSHTRVTCRR